MQYSLVAKSLLATALEYLEKREIRERIKRTENSSQIFGLVPRTAQDEATFSPQHHFDSPTLVTGAGGVAKSDTAGLGHTDRRSTHFSFDFDANFPGLPDFLPASPELGGSFGLDFDPALSSLNLFPLLETDGHIDLANYF
ncbi:fungal-specific transcription factor [Podospora conica]|nr:fungal-specific transcription factor [Schizothecium conicum]